jgi:hypothetical protein
MKNCFYFVTTNDATSGLCELLGTSCASFDLAISPFGGCGIIYILGIAFSDNYIIIPDGSSLEFRPSAENIDKVKLTYSRTEKVPFFSVITGNDLFDAFKKYIYNNYICGGMI